MESLDLLATPLQVRSSSGCVIDGVKVENHIARGNTHEWHHRGSGTGVSITEDSTNTVLRNLLVVRGWNGVGFGGIGTMADNVQIWGFPNHGAGMSGRNNVLSRLRIWNVQDSVWMQDGQNITIQNSHMMEPIHIRVGSSAVKLRNNVIFGGQVYVLEDSKTGFDSDYNLFVTTTWDYRIGSTRANSLDETQRLHGRELHSLTAADTTSVFEGWEGRAALNSVLPLSESSPAIDRGDPAYPVPTGGGTRIDIGPFERGAANDVPGVRVAPQVPPPPGSLGIRR
jgi:hypothetical protein